MGPNGVLLLGANCEACCRPCSAAESVVELNTPMKLVSVKKIKIWQNECAWDVCWCKDLINMSKPRGWKDAENYCSWVDLSFERKIDVTKGTSTSSSWMLLHQISCSNGSIWMEVCLQTPTSSSSISLVSSPEIAEEEHAVMLVTTPLSGFEKQPQNHWKWSDIPSPWLAQAAAISQSHCESGKLRYTCCKLGPLCPNRPFLSPSRWKWEKHNKQPTV